MAQTMRERAALLGRAGAEFPAAGGPQPLWEMRELCGSLKKDRCRAGEPAVLPWTRRSGCRALGPHIGPLREAAYESLVGCPARHGKGTERAMLAPDMVNIR